MDPLSLSADNPFTQGIYHHAPADLIVVYLATFLTRPFCCPFLKRAKLAIDNSKSIASLPANHFTYACWQNHSRHTLSTALHCIVSVPILQTASPN